jgi:hypothetical protein
VDDRDDDWLERRLEPSGDPGHSDAQRRFDWGPGSSFGTEDAARLGLDKHTLEGAQLAFFSHLDGRKPVHRVVAIFFLVLLVGYPLFLTLEHVFG